jgi:hypothetical protein
MLGLYRGQHRANPGHAFRSGLAPSRSGHSRVSECESFKMPNETSVLHVLSGLPLHFGHRPPFFSASLIYGLITISSNIGFYEFTHGGPR